MSNLARKQKYVETVQPTHTVDTQVVPRHKRKQITVFEKVIVAGILAFVLVMTVQVLSTQAKIYAVNENIQDQKSTIQQKEKVNQDLSMQVSELSNYDRISKVAKNLGLKLNEKNVKVVGK